MQQKLTLKIDNLRIEGNARDGITHRSVDGVSMSVEDVQSPPNEDTGSNIEEYISRGQLAASAIDQGRWIIGDDACVIKTQYGKHTLDEYAKAINVAKDRVEDYRGVCKFYSEISVRTEYLESNPMITFSHMRVAKRLKDVQKAYDFLDECSNNAYTVEKARIELQRKLGKPIPPIRESFEAQAIRQAGNGMVLLAMREADLLRRAITDHPDAAIKVTIEYIAKETQS